VVIDRKAEVGFRFGAGRWIGLGANPEVEVQVTSQGGCSIQGLLLRRKWLSRKVFPVLIDYPELSPTRSAQYENRDAECQCRTLAYIPFLPEGEAWLSSGKTGSNPAEPVPTGFL